MIPLVGYADRFSVAPGETIEFKVSSTFTDPYEARLVRLVSGDPNPDGPGIKEIPVPSTFAGSHPSRRQEMRLGSCMRAQAGAALDDLDSFTLAATVWPTTPDAPEQGILARLDPGRGAGFALLLDGARGACALLHTDAGPVRVSTGKALQVRAWYRVWAAWDAASRTLRVGQSRLAPAHGADDEDVADLSVTGDAVLAADVPLFVAALGGDPVGGHYNGKVERPFVLRTAIDDPDPGRDRADVAVAYDFSLGIPGTAVTDVGPHGLDGVLENLPARAVTGSNWSGAEMCWRHAPEEYGAVHFHDDDIYDAGWETDFRFDVPSDLASGVYAARLRCGDEEDMVPFFVRPPRGRTTSSACVLVPTFTYIVYGNYARNVTDDAYRDRVKRWGARPYTVDEHRDYGLSTYDFHRDGSGVSYASRLRPVITMRSAFLAYVDPAGSGLRHLPADLHLIDWLEAKGHDYDVVTDEDLHEEGAGLIAGYKVVMTTTHPEYQSPASLDALEHYVQGGGRLMYLGGNGFYWKVAVHDDYPGAVEIRRAEGGIRAWAAEPGEYYNAFDGGYGGLWRRNGRPPQRLAGVGFTSQGPFAGSYYRRAAGADDPRVSWIFEGVDDEVIGDFGLSGGGAGGFELDRVDHALGSPRDLVVLASSEGHDERFVLVHEDRLTDVTTWSGEPIEDLIRADMVYFDTGGGGAVFSVGSITYCGSLAHDDYDGNVSRITDNVLRRFRS